MLPALSGNILRSVARHARFISLLSESVTVLPRYWKNPQRHRLRSLCHFRFLRRTFYQQEPALLSNMSRAVARMSRCHPYRRAARTLGMVFLPLDFLLQPMLRPLSHSQRMNQSRRKRRNAERALAFDASYKPFKQRK